LNLYVVHTIEEDTYQTLRNRINVFEEVVGPLQPILAEMPRILRRVARGELELADARRLLDEAALEKPRVAITALEECVREGTELQQAAFTPGSTVTQEQLAAWCLAHPAPGMRIIVVPEPGTTVRAADGIPGCLAITWVYAPAHLGIRADEELLATFNGALADRHPPTNPAASTNSVQTTRLEGVRLLTWGDAYLIAWLEAVRGEALTDDDYCQAGIGSQMNPRTGSNTAD
jgi:hypothetical protein